MFATGFLVTESVNGPSVSNLTHEGSSPMSRPSLASMKMGMVAYSYFSCAVMYEAITEYGPACPRAQYQSWTISIRPTLPQLWSWYPVPVVSWRSSPMVYVAVTLPCGTEGSQANSRFRSSPNSM